jgi:hypothetical protein
MAGQSQIQGGQMHHIDILIPTRGRIKKLDRLLDSIPGQVFGVKIYIHVMIDGDWDTYNYFRKDERLILRMFEGHHGSVYLRNFEAGLCDDAILWAVDDMVFKPGAIESAVKEMRSRFFDGDGVIGFTQEGGGKPHPTGVGMMGQKFLRRYPEKKPFFPGQEILWLCEKVEEKEGRECFYPDPKAIIIHKHPCYNPEEMDKTHEDGRIHKKDDMALIKQRQAKGLIWGDR